MTIDYQAKFFTHALTRKRGMSYKGLQQSLLNAAINLNLHQVETVHFALCSPNSKSVILADEVGLDKIIGADLITQACNQILEMLVVDAILRSYLDAVADMKKFLNAA